MKLAWKVAVLTAASSGIGLAAARLFAREGATVILADIDDEAGERAVAEIGGEGGRASYVHTDASSAEDMSRLIDGVVRGHGRLDVLFNGVGINMVKPVPDCTEEDFDAVMNTNVKSTFLGCKFALPHLLESGGVIVNNASNAGLVGRTADPLYAASKHAVNGLTKSLALTYADRGVRVNSVCPGPIATPSFFGNLPAEATAAEREQYLKRAVASCPTPRAAAAEEVAAAILFLACDDSSFVNGATLPVDGAKAAGIFNADRYSLDFDLQ